MKKIEAIVFDWAGTTVDYGCFAPVDAFVKAFTHIGITLTDREARGPMGMTKIDHIRELFRLESVSQQFIALNGRVWTETDVIDMNAKFEELLFQSLNQFTEPIPHVLETVEQLRASGLKIGSTTGYTNAMMDIVAPSAADNGYSPDYFTTSNGLPKGRPAPYMIYQNMIKLAIEDPKQVIKVGDTIADIKEGVNAGVWTIGVILGSSELGLSQDEVQQLSPEELALQLLRVRVAMYQAGAHYVLDSIAELPTYINIINEQMNRA